ncbi:hypothetical protein LJ737_22195 [Hymenobacter sp. 15J16-1T3B]|uniref:hypothetical protein n=1 Tax=Hymenobacter sp. 15J16-1T3B TaxID=2886941 RepID=UPI001D117F6C|nr:hypothetical protein [Hymenobacter sp. 15J16-1T3B]MCC3159965.1 hypothetical protein [Hymenobacter sp. 15J16-1T3B]
MKTFRLAILLAMSTLASVAASAQSRPASSTATRSTTTKPASAAAKPASTTAKTAAKPATAAAKPAATPAPAPAPAPEEAPAKTTTAKTPAKAPAKSAATNGHDFGVGSTAANLGVGFGLGYGYGLFTGIHATPALSVSVERGIVDNIGPGVIGVGGIVGYKGYSWKSGTYKASWKNFIVAARGTYHYNILENPKLDTYAGLTLGVRIESYSTNYDVYSSNYGGVALTSGVFVGARYMLTDNLGAFGELGYDMSLLKLGLTARF